MFQLYFKLLFLFTALLNITNAANSKKCNESIINENKIVGGQATSIISVPYQVAVLVGNSICGGSLISSNIVLTAAHCVADSSPSSIVVRAGSNYYDRDGITLNVLKIIINKNFNFQTMTHDVAVLKLIRSLTLSEMNIHHIKTIALQEFTPPDNSKVIVSGYGKLSSQGIIAFSLQSVSVNIINWNQCNQKYGRRLTTTMFCAGSLRGGKDSCQGDSGGPLAYQGKLLGIVSWGYGCASALYPGIYSSIPVLYTWIKNIIAEI